MKQMVEVVNCTIEREMHYQTARVLQFKINYPQFQSVDFLAVVNRMNRYYKCKADAFQRYCECQLYRAAVKDYKYAVANGFPVREYEAQVNYTVTYNQNCAVSLYFDGYQFTGGAHGNTVRTSQTWNLQTGCRITLRQLFPRGVDYKKLIIETVKRQIASQIQNGTNYYFDNYEKLVDQTFQPCNFYLMPNQLAVYFQQYDIAPYSSGIPVFLIPYTKSGIIPPSCQCR